MSIALPKTKQSASYERGDGSELEVRRHCMQRTIRNCTVFNRRVPRELYMQNTRARDKCRRDTANEDVLSHGSQVSQLAQLSRCLTNTGCGNISKRFSEMLVSLKPDKT